MFRFSEIFHVAFELAVRRPVALIPAILVALLTLLLAGLGASASFGLDPESPEFLPALMRKIGDLSLFEFAWILAIAGLFGGIIFLVFVIVRHLLLSSIIAKGAQPHVLRSLLSSCAIASFFFVPVAVLILLAAVLIAFVPPFSASLVAVATTPIIMVVIVLTAVSFLTVALILRFALLYTVSVPLSPLSAVRLGATLFRANVPTVLVATGIITLSVAAFTGLSNLAILYTSRVSNGAGTSVLALSLGLVVPAALLGIANLLSEALWAAFFYLIARTPDKPIFTALTDDAVEKLESSGTLPPQA